MLRRFTFRLKGYTRDRGETTVSIDPSAIAPRLRSVDGIARIVVRRAASRLGCGPDQLVLIPEVAERFAA